MDISGLSEEEVKRRLKKFGYNKIIEKKVNPIVKFLSYFWSPIPWMIEIALMLSALVHRWSDFYIILVLLIVNGLVGFWQENRAENAIEGFEKAFSLKSNGFKRHGKLSRQDLWFPVISSRLE